MKKQKKCAQNLIHTSHGEVMDLSVRSKENSEWKWVFSMPSSFQRKFNEGYTEPAT